MLTMIHTKIGDITVQEPPKVVDDKLKSANKYAQFTRVLYYGSEFTGSKSEYRYEGIVYVNPDNVVYFQGFETLS